MPSFTVGDDPLLRELQESAEEAIMTLRAVLLECGVDLERFNDNADRELSMDELENLLGIVWTQLARAGALEEQWKKKKAEREEVLDGRFAGAYATAVENLPPKATEAAKKNWIVENATNVTDAKRSVQSAEYLSGVCARTRKALEMRCNMLQSIKGLKVSELERLGGTLRDHSS